MSIFWRISRCSIDNSRNKRNPIKSSSLKPNHPQLNLKCSSVPEAKNNGQQIANKYL
jgi:hypothetical protein